MKTDFTEIVEQFYSENCESEPPKVDSLSHEIVDFFYLEELTNVTIEQILKQKKYEMDLHLAVQNKIFINHVTEDWFGLFVEIFEHILECHYFVCENNSFRNHPIRKVW